MLLTYKIMVFWAVVVTQLVEWSRPTPEVHGSNPVVGELLFIKSLLNVMKRRK